MIHIIDDDHHIRDGFSMLIKSANFKCSCFESAEKFLENYKSEENDLIVLDMNLTGMNGCNLLEVLESKGLHLPVIVVTAFDEPKYRKCCKEYGVIAYLRKPVDGDALIDLIKYNFEPRIQTNTNIST
jgi:FixJ family two-component response regulator